MFICARICLGVGSRWCECGGMWWYFLFVLRVCCGTSVIFTREGWGGGGGGDAPCIPVRGHVITHRYAIVHTCTVQFSRPPLCHAHCHLIPCGTHAFTTAFRHSQCTLACTECNARMASSSFGPTNCLSSTLHLPLPPKPSPASSHMDSLPRVPPIHTFFFPRNSLGPWLALTMSYPPKPPSHHTRISVFWKATACDGVWGRYWVQGR